MILLVLALQTQVTGSISGVVRDFTGKPLDDAVVSIQSASRYARTDSTGAYRLDAVPAGTVHMMAWALGHETENLDQVVTGGQQLRVDFVLRERQNTVFPAGSGMGRYHLDSVPAGAIEVLVRRIGYDVGRTRTRLATGQQLDVDFVLHMRVFQLGASAIPSRLHLE